MHRAGLMALALIVALSFLGCKNVPDHTDAFLSFPYGPNCGSYDNCAGMKDQAEAANYYKAMGIDPDNYFLRDWLFANGFPPSDESPVPNAYYPHTDAHAIYANLGDLQIGRDMNCVQSGQKIACYVSNYGFPFNGNPPDIDAAILCAVRGPGSNCIGNVQFSEPFATVAMVYDPTQGGPNNVTFFVFDDFGKLIPSASLDGEGIQLDQNGDPVGKTVPRMCMACHGGTYDTNTHTGTGSSFLPFDVYFFRYFDATGFSLEDQQEALRKLNALVSSTNPNQPIIDFINGMYPDGVVNSGSEAVEGYLPAAWSDNPTLYTGVVRQYCRMCHLAQPGPLAFTATSQFEDAAAVVKNMVCDKHDMPHAQVPYGISSSSVGFWNDPVAQRDLGDFFKSQGVNSCLPSN